MIFADIYEYAAYCGARDFTLTKYNPDYFADLTGLADTLQSLYELGWLLECESSALRLSEPVELKAFIREWNDVVGYGKLEWVLNGEVCQTGFSYRDLDALDADKVFEAGDIVNAIFEYGIDSELKLKQVRLG